MTQLTTIPMVVKGVEFLYHHLQILLVWKQFFIVLPVLLFLSDGSVTCLPFLGNTPVAMPRVVAKKVDPEDSVPNTVINLLGSTESRCI